MKVYGEKKARKHLGTGGMFQDQFKRLRDPKLEKLYKDIEIDAKTLKNEDLATKITTGDELRSNRERDKVLVKKELDEAEAAYVAANGPRITELPKRRKRTSETVSFILDALNAMMESKEKLTESERAGLIDFAEFDIFAVQIIPDYVCDSVVAKNTHSWITYHRKKKELKLATSDLSKSFKWTFEESLGGLQGNTEKKRMFAQKKAEANVDDMDISEGELKRLASLAAAPPS